MDENLGKLHEHIPSFITISDLGTVFQAHPLITQSTDSTKESYEVNLTINGMLEPNITWEEQKKYLWNLERTDDLVHCYNCGYLFGGHEQCNCLTDDLLDDK